MVDMKKDAAIIVVALLVAASVCIMINITTVSASWKTEISYGAGGRVHGHVYGFNVYDELVTLSWATVAAVQDGETVETAYSFDGFYEMYLPSGTFDLVVEAPGYFSETRSVFIGDGSDFAIDFFMERNNQPIPEFPTLAIQAISMLSLLATLLLVRKKTRAKG